MRYPSLTRIFSSWRLLAILAINLLVLGGIYRLPYASTQDVDTWAGLGNGLHGVEELGGMTYVHTDGDAYVDFPETGLGSYAIDVRLGGTGGTIPTEMHLTIDEEPLALGTISTFRVYHLLVSSNEHGDIGVRIQSSTVQPPDDPRHLGVLIDWFRLRSLGPSSPPASVLGAAAICLALFTVVFVVLGARRSMLLTLLAVLSVVLGVGPLLYRGQAALTPWWIGLSLSAIAGLGLAIADRLSFLMTLPGIVATFSAWRVMLWLVGGAGIWWSEIVNRHARGLASFGAIASRHDAFTSRALVGAWMQWDSLHYEAIASTGYTFAGVAWPTVAFFPLYPLLMRVVMPFIGGSASIAALAIAHLALLIALLLLYDLVAHDFGRVVAYRSVLALLVFPTSYYFGAGYTESLALVLAVGVVWALRREHWWLAGAAGFLLALTRVPGVMIAPVLACAYLRRQGWSWRSMTRLTFLAVLLPPLGLASFMLYQWSAFGTPFAFLIAQKNWDNGMAAPWVMPEKIIRAVWSSPTWELAAVQLVALLSCISLTLIACRRLPVVYWLTAVLLLLPAFLANNAGSLVRHVLIGFPVFVMLALLIQRLWVRWLVFSVMFPLLIVLTLLFVNGFGLF